MLVLEVIFVCLYLFQANIFLDSLKIHISQNREGECTLGVGMCALKIDVVFRNYRDFYIELMLVVGITKNPNFRWKLGFLVVPPGIEPGTQGFSVLCSTNWAMAPTFRLKVENWCFPHFCECKVTINIWYNQIFWDIFCL